METAEKRAEARAARLRAMGIAGKLPSTLNPRVVDAALRYTGERFFLADGKVAGLALDVHGDRSASWVLQARTLDSRPVRCGLGGASEVSIEQARAEAQRLRAEIKDGRNPVAD